MLLVDRHRFILIHTMASVNRLSTSVKQTAFAMPTISPLSNSVYGHTAMQVDEEILAIEIEFWRDMITSRRGTVSEQAYERMVNACELAERKLMLVRNVLPVLDTRQ